MDFVIETKNLNIDLTGKKDVTKQLQNVIDEVSLNKGKLILSKGKYLCSCIFLKSNMCFIFEDGATLVGSLNEEAYPLIYNRVAGIEMNWYPAILNCIDATNVKIKGNGIIDGNGKYFWDKYWTMRKEYDAKGLRWACDYDCLRVRNILIMNSNHITIKDITSKQSGFWNLHLLYCDNIVVDNIKIKSDNAFSPSTDGIDVDSSSNVLIENCNITCNDDSICIKSGRDSDGLRVAKASKNITIRNCQILSGFGITIGSELSGGISDININNISFNGTDCGFRIKSGKTRKGYIKNVKLSDLSLINVKYIIQIQFNWNSSYSLCKIPLDFKGIIPEHYNVLCAPVDENIPNTIVDNILIENVDSSFTDDYKGISRAFQIEGFQDQRINNFCINNFKVKCKEFGIINYVDNLKMKNVDISVLEAYQKQNDEYDNR